MDKVILFGPGIYTSQAYDKHFGEQFREAVSTPFSYRETDVISILEAYKGELLLIRGEYDEPVTEEFVRTKEGQHIISENLRKINKSLKKLLGRNKKE